MLIYLNLVGKYLLIMEKMSFNLNTFIEKYKYHLPKYFLSLNEKKTSKQDIFNAKSVLISFIKNISNIIIINLTELDLMLILSISFYMN